MIRKAWVLWFTGLSGAGKSTIAQQLCGKLRERGARVEMLDGDQIRATYTTHLGFSREDICENNRIIARLCQDRIRDCDYVIVPVISPFRASRAQVREMIGDSFRLIYCKAKLAEVIRRDVKGLYKKALAGEIENFIGLSPNVPYEEPFDADVVLDTEELGEKESVEKMLAYLEGLK